MLSFRFETDKKSMMNLNNKQKIVNKSLLSLFLFLKLHTSFSEHSEHHGFYIIVHINHQLNHKNVCIFFLNQSLTHLYLLNTNRIGPRV